MHSRHEILHYIMAYGRSYSANQKVARSATCLKSTNAVSRLDARTK
jgi:hypothetical protein